MARCGPSAARQSWRGGGGGGAAPTAAAERTARSTCGTEDRNSQRGGGTQGERRAGLGGSLASGRGTGRRSVPELQQTASLNRCFPDTTML